MNDNKKPSLQTKPPIPADQLMELYELKPFRSITAIILDWALIILAIIICEKVSYWLYPIAFVVVGSRFHALEGMMHEAAHFRIHPSKKVNDFIGELIVWPLGLTLVIYRKLIHLAHHKNIGTKLDPHKHFIYKPEMLYKPHTNKKELLKNVLYVGINFLPKLFRLYKNTNIILPKLSKTRYRLWLLFQISVVLFLVFGTLFLSERIIIIYLLFFLLPQIWVAIFPNYLRLLAEHFHIPGTPHSAAMGANTRTVKVSWPVRVVFWPHNLNYHQEHHWYPAVPYYNLPKLHDLLYAQRKSGTK
jgi:fatty acid desaturase